MDKSVHLPRDPDSSRLKTEDVVKLVRPSDRIRAQIPVPTTYVGQALSFGQLSLALLELLLGLLALGDVLGDGNFRPVRKVDDSTSRINHPPVPYLYFEIDPFTS